MVIILIKMIVTDLDRTLLHSDKSISEYTAMILRQCQERGIKVVFATARPKRTVNHFLDSIPADAVILHNGAVIYIGDECYSNYGIESATARNLLLAINRDWPETTLSVEIDDVFYANFDVSTIWNNTQAIHTDFTDLPDKPADKIIVGVSSMSDIQRFSKYLPAHLYIEMNDGKLGLIMNRGAAKQNAVRILADYYSFDMSETVAFGDDYNDLQMLRDCGIGVAMENALDEVKAAADSVCDTNDNDGVSKWLEENVL